MLVVGSIVIRVDDLSREIAFWTAALDYAVREPAAEDFVVLQPVRGDGPNISLDVVPAPRVLPPRIHLDLYADDQAQEVHWDKRPADADYVIMEDPEGNRFCVIDASDWPGWEASGRVGRPAPT